MTMGVFANCTFCLNIKHLPRQQKKKLQTDIQENGGNISFILNPQCTHIISDSAGHLSRYHLNSIQKNQIHIANPDFIWESIKEQRLLDVKNYSPNKSPDSTLPLCQEDSSSEVGTDDGCLDISMEIEDVELTKFNTENVEVPHFPQDFEVAKYNTLEKVGTEGGQDIVVLELQCPRDPGHPTFRISVCHLLAEDTETKREFFVRPTSADASECYENYIDELKKQGFRLREDFTPEATQLASGKLQAWLLEEDIRSGALSQEVSDLVEMVWAEALGHLEHTLLTPANRISLNDVSKAEGILLHAKAALKSGETEEQLQKMISEFYRLIPHRGSTTEKVNLRLLAKKEDLCQLIRDMANVNETNLSKPNPPSLAKYRALRCKIEHVKQNTEEFFRVRKEVLQNNRSQSPADILQIFRVGRASETTAFLSQLGNVTPLLHGSAVRSFVGILSRGLLLPKVVEDRGVTRTDVGNLGSGIYFSDSLSTSTKYSHPGDTDGTRLLVICDVALGKCLDLHKKDFSLTEAPPGYDSVHGVPGTAAVITDFEDDEFVVYKTNQVKMKYIIKFCLPEDELKDFHPCNNTELEEHMPRISDFSIVEDYQLPDGRPSSSLGAGLQDASGNLVPLEDVCIRGEIIDFVAQVIVCQTYTNQSHVPIEAKYVFPLDDKAAVCGFEAFINGKHIVGEIKEKEAAHQEYREAISQGHGAYLMDQDAPDVFTVSVGNLPPKAKVLIKITYITELSIQGTVAVFFMPATVAPWQQDRALNENIQDTVKKICVQEIGSKQSFSLSMSIEMPYVIEFISSDTHELKKKRTDCKAVISTVEGSTLDSSGFSLHVGLTDAHLPRMWVEKHPEKESEACMLVFHPDLGSALPDTAEKSEVVICLDCSSSMEGVTFLHAKQIALYALSLVGQEQKVNVVKFGSGYQELFSYPKGLTSDSVAAEFITSASPTMGSTDFWKVLRYLSLLPPAQGLRNVLLISDGHLQGDSLTLQLVERHVRHTRLLSCGVGPTANRHLLRTLSQHGVGAFEYFNSKSKHSWKKQVEDQMARSRSPSCHSVSVTWQQFSPEAPEPLQAPAQVQALFHGDRLLVYGFIPRCTQATLRALTQEKEFSTMVSTTELQKTTGTMIHKLTARALIRDYEDGILHDDETNHEMKKQVLKSLIIQLSKENCLITQFTSFVAVEKRDGNESPFPNNPNILELVAKDVDLLPYMDWQEEQPRGFYPCSGSARQPLSASSGSHGEFRPKRLSKRKKKRSTVEVFGDFQGLSLASKAPQEPFKFGWKYAHAEMPLDLSQMEPRTHKGSRELLTTAISLPKAGFSPFAAPVSAGSPATLGSISFPPPCSPRAPLFGCSGAALSGPATGDPEPDTGCGTNVFLEQGSALRGPPPNPPVEPFIGSVSVGGLFGFGQFSLSTTDKGLKARRKSGTFLEMDSSPQPSPPCFPPSPPSPLPGGSSCCPLPSPSPFTFPESAASLSTSYEQPAHVFGLARNLFGASPSSLPAINAVSHQGLRSEAAASSLGTEDAETQGFLRITPCKEVAKSHVAGREFTASSQAREDQGFGTCQQSQWKSMLWTRLFGLQTEDGFWKLTPELGFILNLNTDILNNFLEQKGIRSLGVKGRERLLDLIATFLVLQFLRTQLEQKGIVFKSLMKLDDAAISRDIPWASEKIKKASEWVRRTERQYPSICQRLELGKDWDSAIKQLLRPQPVNTTSPLHRVLNYNQILIGNL